MFSIIRYVFVGATTFAFIRLKDVPSEYRSELIDFMADKEQLKIAALGAEQDAIDYERYAQWYKQKFHLMPIFTDV